MNLESSIAEWRRQMLAAGVRSPVPLDELENHLRETVESQMQSGLAAQPAFEIAVQQIGLARPIKAEFVKIERNIMNRKVIVGLGIFILLLGTTMILPALGKHKNRNHDALAAGANFSSVQWAEDEKFGLLLGTSLALGGTVTALYGFKKRKA